MAQNISITYNGFTIGSSSSTIRDGKFRLSHSYRRFTMDVDFVVTGTTDADFVTNTKAAEDALEVDSKRLTITIGASTYRDYDPATGTGFRARTSLTKTGDNVDTDRSRLYSWAISIDLPADSTDDGFRQEASWGLTFTPTCRMRLNFSGTYTAGDGVTATAKYNDATTGADAWISTIFTQLNTDFTGVTITEADFEPISEVVDGNDENDSVSFRREYIQVLFPDATWTSGTPNNNTSIKNANVSFTRVSNHRHGNNQKGSITLNISYSCDVDTKQTGYSGLAALYTGTIKPWILEQAKTRWSGSFASIESESPVINVTNNTISASLTVFVFAGNANKLREDVTIVITQDPRKSYTDIWDGKDYTYSVHSPGPMATAIMTTRVEQMSGFPKSLPPAPPAPLSVNEGGWDATPFTITDESEWVGNDPDNTGDKRQIYSRTFSQNFRWVASARNIQDFGQPQRLRTVLRRT